MSDQVEAHRSLLASATNASNVLLKYKYHDQRAQLTSWLEHYVLGGMRVIVHVKD
jgi:hypothetical protein